MIRYLKNIVIFILSLDKYILYKIYNFDKWHSQTIYGEKYSDYIIKYIDKNIDAESIVEIGCGLGNILLRTNVKYKTGLDQSIEVLKAARLISRFRFVNAKFRVFSFLEENLNNKHDIILLVNWPHIIDKFTLKNKLNYLFNTNLNKNGSIIIDTVSHNSYTFNHNIDFLAKELDCKIIKIGSFSKGREVWRIIRKK